MPFKIYFVFGVADKVAAEHCSRNGRDRTLWGQMSVFDISCRTPDRNAPESKTDRDLITSFSSS